MSNNLFGRRWSLSLLANGSPYLTTDSKSFSDPESIQVSFDVFQPGYQAFWFADIILWNLSEKTNMSIQYGDDIILSAGYQDQAPFGVIFKGKVWQPMWDRVDVVNYKTTLRCVVGKIEEAENFINLSLTPAMMEQADLITAMASSCHTPLEIGSVPNTILPLQKPRTKILFNTPGFYLKRMADDNGWQTWLSDKGINMGNILEDVPKGQALVINSKTGLVGVPQQIKDGITFKTLLDPRIKIQVNPPMQIFIDNSTIRQMKKELGVNPSFLDKDGYYNVGGIHHYGDTRGNDWYTEVIGYSNIYGITGLLVDVSAPTTTPKQDVNG